MRKKPNLLLIVIDALRAKNLGCYRYAGGISPAIDNLAGSGALFRDAFSCTNATDPSLATIFSGKFPRTHGIVHHGPQIQVEEMRSFLQGTLTLPEMLKLADYRTFAVDWLGRWHKKGYDYYSGILRAMGSWGGKEMKRGQTRDYDEEGMGVLPKRLWSMVSELVGSPGISPRTEVYGDASIVTQKALEIIRENRKHNFFLFVHYWDTHFPYYRPIAYEKRYVESEEDPVELRKIAHKRRRKQVQRMGGISKVIDMYDGAIAFIDHEVSRIINLLRQLGILDKTLIILTADHGESLTEHGIYFDHHGLYNETIHVPLIFRYSELPAGKVVDGFVQHTDITPTILDILNIQSSTKYDGKSLLPLIFEGKQLNSEIYAEETHVEKKQMIATPKYKYICAASAKEARCRYCGRIHGGIEELYDLGNDPGETRNIVTECFNEATELKRRLSKWVMHMDSKREKAMLQRRIKVLKREIRV